MSSIEGLDELLATLSGLGGDIKQSSLKGGRRGMKKVQKNAKILCPVETGQLRNSIKEDGEINGDEINCKVYTNSDHAIYPEFGTGQRGTESNIDRPERNILQSRLERTISPTIYDTSISTCKKYWRGGTRSN